MNAIVTRGWLFLRRLIVTAGYGAPETPPATVDIELVFRINRTCTLEMTVNRILNL